MSSGRIFRALQVLVNSQSILGDGVCANIVIALKNAPLEEVIICESFLIAHKNGKNYETWNITSIGNCVCIIKNSPSKKLKDFFTNQLSNYLEYVATTKQRLNTKNVDLNVAYQIILE